MKIKTWLLLTYLLVMLLPLAGVYGLYLSINDYYKDKQVTEYFEKHSTLNKIKKVVSQYELYQRDADFTELEVLVSNEVQITLYGGNGQIFYTSNPIISQVGSYESKKILFQGLYEFKQNYRTFTYKEPIYVKGRIVGIYEVVLLRTEWVEQVNKQTYLVAGGIVLFLVVIYGGVIFFLNRRLNRPVKELILQMKAFAKGEKVPSKLHEKKDELGELAWSFLVMQQEIELARKQIQEEQGQKEFMIASLSHDLKTPLTSIQAYAESLKNGQLSNEEKHDYLKVILTKSDFMKQMLDDLMMYTLLQSPSYELHLVEVEGEEYFDMLLSDYEQVSREKGFSASTLIQIEGMYEVNPKQLMRVVDNLLANAWRYTETGGRIEIYAFEPPFIPTDCKKWVRSHLTKQEGLYMIVQNSGKGIPAEQCQQLFEPLYQLDQARSQNGQRGAGLGLSIAQQIIEKHGGKVGVASHEKQGTAIICWIPKKEE
ncbi:two-component sensor histidine kinase [Solibacillus sp. R5-41]|uniref:HAMP domain-containing sensor histidine kinase n=1 Tax=Solibacillus sp. R5-41 TaxID=2048654 RepID=UPI000C12970F|nr:HAMP domain-containing sensor histidine kinase [Solibacillus sp. R5-41]ATP41986.1 two-component sensor histidine kinase [Solibacillus sp. R5-41]